MLDRKGHRLREKGLSRQLQQKELHTGPWAHTASAFPCPLPNPKYFPCAPRVAL